MKVNRVELQRALEIVKPGLAGKEMIQQSTSFAFQNGVVTTYNDEISISHPVEGLEIEGAIRAEELYKLLSKLKTDEIDVTITGSEIQIQSGRAKAGISLQSEIKLPLDEEISDIGKWKALPENFLRFVRFAIGSCSKHQSEPILTCIHINKEGFMESSDGQRIVHCELQEPMPIHTFLLPASSAEEVIKLEPTKVAEGKGWVHFKTDNQTVISCRIYAEKYPNTTHLLNVKGTLLIFPQTLEAVLDRAGIFSRREHATEEAVSITIQNNRLKLSSTSDSGWFEEEVNIAYDGDVIDFDVTPYLLKGILSETQGCYYNESRLKFEGEGWVYISTLRTRNKKK